MKTTSNSGELQMESKVDKWISKIWAVSLTLTIGMLMFIIAYTATA